MANIAVTDAAAPSTVAKPFLTRLGAGFVNRLVIIIPYLWLLFFFLIPFVIVFKISLSQTAIAMPPYTPVLDFSDGVSGFFAGFRDLNFDNYVWLTQDALYFKAYVSSVIIAAISTVLTLIVGYPIAYGMARAPATIRPTLLMLVILPFWTSFLIRVYAWIGILKPEGPAQPAAACRCTSSTSRWSSSTPTPRSSSASSIPTCRSWCCRSIRRWKRWTTR